MLISITVQSYLRPQLQLKKSSHLALITLSAEAKRWENLCLAFPISLLLVLSQKVGIIVAFLSLFPYIQC